MKELKNEDVDEISDIFLTNFGHFWRFLTKFIIFDEKRWRDFDNLNSGVTFWWREKTFCPSMLLVIQSPHQFLKHRSTHATLFCSTYYWSDTMYTLWPTVNKFLQIGTSCKFTTNILGMLACPCQIFSVVWSKKPRFQLVTK